METFATARKSGGEEGRPDAGPDARRSGHRQTARAAQVAFDGSVLHCALLDASRGGARVYLLTPAAVPETATLRLLGGASWAVRRRWQKGALVGFSVVEALSPPSTGGLPAAAAVAAWW